MKLVSILIVDRLGVEHAFVDDDCDYFHDTDKDTVMVRTFDNGDQQDHIFICPVRICLEYGQ